LIGLDKQFVKIASGPKHCAALTENGLLYTWGSGYQYKLGHGTTGDELIPRLVSKLTELCVKSVSCGLHHTAALVSMHFVFFIV
jgi:alpha-tubulin suppressor-like RCC1 family protein